MPKKKKEKTWLSEKTRHILSWILLCVVLMASVLLVEINTEYFHASLIKLETVPPFDGTVYPVQQVPDWVQSSADEREFRFGAFPAEKLVSIPLYEPQKLTTVASALDWSNPAHNLIRNAQVTYSVPYLGTYNLDGNEGEGSHPAVDIKALKGTPIYAIANGRVEKVSMQSNGFGHHVVIEHKDVPGLEDEKVTQTLISSYSHLDEVQVNEGDIVNKGTQLGTVGDTGTATTDHLHFQIDKDNAPFHPYWPFTYTEAQNAGYSFFEAVNAGFGKANAKKYTIHPMNYVEKYLSYAGGTVSDPEDETEEVIDTKNELEKEDVEENMMEDETEDESETETETADNELETEPEVSVNTVDEPEETAEILLNVADFNFIQKEVYTLKNTVIVNIEALDKDGTTVKEPRFKELTMELNKGGIAELSKTEFTSADFTKGKTSLLITPKETGWFKIYLYLEGTRMVSPRIDIVEPDKEIDQFGFEHDGTFITGIPEAIKLMPLDEDGNRLTKYKLQGTVRLSLKEGEGTFSSATLERSDFKDGAATFKFTPTTEKPVSFKAINRGVEGISKPIIFQVFTDVGLDHKYFEAIKTLKVKEIIGGYEDESFKPAKKVARVEALKMIFEAVELDSEMTEEGLPFSDVSADQWYVNYVATAYDLQIVNGYPDGSFRPGNNISRVEFVKIMINALEIDVDPMVKEDPYEDVNRLEWYAPYVQWAKSKNLLPVEGAKLNPGDEISRGEVAEIIYRTLVLIESGNSVYTTK